MESLTGQMIELAKKGVTVKEIAEKLSIRESQVADFVRSVNGKELGVYARAEVDSLIHVIHKKVSELVEGISANEKKMTALDKSRVALNIAKVCEILSKNGSDNSRQMYDGFEMKIRRAVRETEKIERKIGEEE